MQEQVDFLIISGVGDAFDRPAYGLAVKNPGGLPPPMRTLGPSKIANRVREAGYTCQVIDFYEYFERDELLLAIHKFIGPKTVLGISTTFFPMSMWRKPNEDSRALDLRFIIEYCKKKFKTKVVVGGPSAQKFARVFYADKIIIGYAENEIVKLMDEWRNHGISKKTIPFWDIKTCEHRWHESNFIFENEALPIEIGRGCIFHCKFCRFEMLGKKKGTYVRTFDRIYDEIMYNYTHFKTTKYLIVEDTFNDDQTKMKAWFDMVRSLPFKIEYTAYLRTDLLHAFPDTAYELYETGLLSASLGIETLHPVAAKAIGKYWSAKHGPTFVPKLVNEIWQGKVIARLNWIVGLPGEDEKSWEKTKNWIFENNLKCPLFAPLSIVPHNPREGNDPNILRSIFDKEMDAYGYKMGFPDKPLDYWENEHMNYDSAGVIAGRLNSYFEKTGQIGNWRAMALLATGISHDYLLNTPRIKLINDPMVIKKITEHVQNYKDKILD